MSINRSFDYIVLGQGLAGTAIGWWLRWSRARFLLIDRETPVTPSRISPGLMTPITGQKIVRTWRHAEVWPTAVAFYRRVEEESGTEFFRETAMVRLFQTDEEVLHFQRRRSQSDFANLVGDIQPPLNQTAFTSSQGGFEMTAGGQLNVREYLDASRRYFEKHGMYQSHDVDVSREIELTEEGVLFPSLGVLSRRIIFCQGIDAMTNPWFRDVKFKPAKGEILTLRIPSLREERVVHHGVWLAPIGADVFKVGSTYDWKNLDSTPTQSGREQILESLNVFLRVPYEVIGHEAAVRPIHRNQYPVIGVHADFPHLAYMNGLGSKGSLLSPFIAKQLLDSIASGKPIDREVDLNLKRDHRLAAKLTALGSDAQPAAVHVKRSEHIPLTQQAQEYVRDVLCPGEVAIDATAGNGYDTHFLALQVGEQGAVFAFDIQQLAIDNTAKRLKDANLRNVTLLVRSHDRMAESIPVERHGQVGAIMFNLGYLPHGDKSLTTQADSTVSSLRQAINLIRPGGIVTALAYTGHDGGDAEATEVKRCLNSLHASDFNVSTIEGQPGRVSGPRLFLVKRC